jgi:hypothetical protein
MKSKRRTTMAKLARERLVQERRALKREKKAARQNPPEPEEAQPAGADAELTPQAGDKREGDPPA